MQNAIACAAHIFELMEEESLIPDAEDATVLVDDVPAELLGSAQKATIRFAEKTGDGRDRVEVDGDVSLKDVCFSYVPEKKLIQNFNLTVTPGQRIAIVGPTGCGKTTVINLLMRF